MRPARVEEKCPQEIFRVISEMQFLGKIRASILDFVRFVEILAKFGAKLDFRVYGLRKLGLREAILGFKV